LAAVLVLCRRNGAYLATAPVDEMPQQHDLDNERHDSHK
jgi:hypothetical protein